jgi:hypothetical protein
MILHVLEVAIVVGGADDRAKNPQRPTGLLKKLRRLTGA